MSEREAPSGRASREPLAADDPRHGTRNGYSNLRCRCERCRAAHAAAHKAYLDAHPEQRARNRAWMRANPSPLQPGHHGKQTGYARGCRCEACRAAHSEHNKRWHRARAAQSAAQPKTSPGGVVGE